MRLGKQSGSPITITSMLACSDTTGSKEPQTLSLQMCQAEAKRGADRF